ncbi:MAG: 4-(cytidine 5'-diphospho)-2-C-methyl-D-erythritol kinase [Desulfovibrio sp.]|jgi:4-diphosphocytidyl-2-C-methyl-D-erythritol kinase|nr:4-(cytidine 5'-diphospho)-2-C-methyl-D-erythritol kinase [Desulfovibrio sp.]
MPHARSLVRLSNGCKVNFGLRVVGVRPDGYHKLDSVFYPLPYPRDDLTVRRLPGSGIRVICADPDVDIENNTLTKAYAAFAEAAGAAPGIEVFLQKRIPVGAGLGGGSGNAAVLLRWLNMQSARPLDAGALAGLALTVGADAPFFLRNVPCRVQGIGESLTPVASDLSGCLLVLVCPDVQVSTRRAYADYDALILSSGSLSGQNSLTKSSSRDKRPPSFEAAQETYPCFTPGSGLANDLEAAVFPGHPQLASIKAELLRLGAEAACMSGSGSGLFGLFPRCGAEAAAKAAFELRAGHRRVFLLRL